MNADDPILTYGEGLGASLTQSLATNLADTLASDVPPDVTVGTDYNGDVTITGSNLLHRYMSDVRLYSIPMIASGITGGVL